MESSDETRGFACKLVCGPIKCSYSEIAKTKGENMRSKALRSRLGSQSFHCLMAVLSAALLLPRYAMVAQTPPPAQSQVLTTTTPIAEEPTKLPNDQLDSLVAPIALYPDPLLAQTLAASTYPLEIIQLQQWMENNKNLKDKALCGRSGKTALGPERPVHGRCSGGPSADGD